MRDHIRLVHDADELAGTDLLCTLCGSIEKPFLALPIPTRLLGLLAATEGGEFLLCGDCLEAVCRAGGVETKARADALAARAHEAEQALAAAGSVAKRDAATIKTLEKKLLTAEAQVTSARGERDSAVRRVEELLEDPAVAARERLKERLAAPAAA